MLVDILPSICRYMDFKIPRDVRFEEDGIPFTGDADIYSLTTHPYDNSVTLRWKHHKSKNTATIYMATSNQYKTGGKDEWIKIGEVKASKGEFSIDLSQYPSSKFYKFVVETPYNHLTRWLYK